MLPGLEVRRDQDVAVTGDGRNDALGLGRLLRDGVIEGERAVDQAAGDLSAVSHLAEGDCLHRRGDLRVDGLDGGEDGDLGNDDVERVGQNHGFCTMSRLVSGSG